ncbi:MAG: NifU family protein [Atopobiaceae bacterium]|nr:NifU family protein [Atopobiaceae bacterium]
MSEEKTTSAVEQAQDTANGGINMELLEAVIDTIRPSLQADGGDCELVGVNEDGVVMLELQGACAGCSLSNFTLSMGVERILKEHVPGVTAVQAVY